MSSTSCPISRRLRVDVCKTEKQSPKMSKWKRKLIKTYIFSCQAAENGWEKSSSCVTIGMCVFVFFCVCVKTRRKPKRDRTAIDGLRVFDSSYRSLTGTNTPTPSNRNGEGSIMIVCGICFGCYFACTKLNASSQLLLAAV